jgi:Flp pilus assembly protein TadD
MRTQSLRTLWIAVLLAVASGGQGCAHGSGAAGERSTRPWSLGSGASRGDESSFEDLMRSADRFRENGDTERALVGYLRALNRDPERPLARIRLAQLQLPKDPERAAAGFRHVLLASPDDARALTGLGVASLALGRLEEARAAFERAAESSPESALPRAGQAVALDLLGRHEEARAKLASARDLHPDDAWLLNNFGVSRLLARDFAGAESALRAAAELESDDTTALNNLGLALGGQGRYAEALSVFLAAGSERAARNNLGYVYYLNGRYREAVEQYELALAADGGEARVVFANLNSALAALQGETARAATPVEPR